MYAYIRPLQHDFWGAAFPLLNDRDVDPANYEKITIQQAVEFLNENGILVQTGLQQLK